MGSRTVWLWFFVASLGVTALLGVVALLTPGFPFQGPLLATSALLSAYSLLGLVATVPIARGRCRKVVWAAVGCLACSFVGWLVLTWFDRAIGWDAQEQIAKTALTLLTFGVLGLHGVLLHLVRLVRPLGRTVRTGTIAAACAGCALMLGALWDAPLIGNSDIGRFVAALLIPSALGTIAVPVLGRIEYLGGVNFDDDSLDRHVPVVIRCPRCELERTAPANRTTRCSGCGLQSVLSFTEPRCACGYLLYGLPEPKCPECGRDVPEEKLWDRGRAASAEPVERDSHDPD